MVSFRYKWISLVAALGSWYCSSQFYVVADPQVVNAVDPIIALPVADQPTQAIPVEPPVAKPVQLPELPPLAPMAEARPISAPVLTKKQAPPSLTFRRKKSPANRLLLSEVMEPLSRQYPPYLAALIERDIAMGRLRTAQGVFDVEAYAKVFSNAAGFYEATTQDIGFEQYLGTHGSTIFGGYKRTDGFLPDYYHERRTNAGGTPYLGVKLPLMRDGSIDKKRASIMKAKLQKQLAEPLIRKQSIAFSKAAMNAYFAWLSAGQRLQLAEELLQIATDRESAIETQIKKGMSAPLLAKENRQLVVSREIATVHANREFEVASIALSLFYRDSNDEGIVPAFPPCFPRPVGRE